MSIHASMHPTVLVIVSAAMLSYCGSRQQAPVPTVSGPESNELLPRVHGWIVLDRPVGGIVAHSLADGRETVVRAPGKNIGTIHSLSGPDHDGRVAFVENHMVEERHMLKVIKVDGTGERTVVERKGDALWSHNGDEIGDCLALAPAGGLVAFVADLQVLAFGAPGAKGANRAAIGRGHLSIWNIETSKELPLTASALDEALCWFPDGKRLAYVDMLDNDEAFALVRKQVDANEQYAHEWADWPRVPVVCVLDIETGEQRPLQAGEQPVVAPDGRHLLIRDFAQRWRLLDLETDTSRAVDATGRIFPGAIAFAAPSLVVYWSWPTEGAEQGWTENNSPLVGPKPMRALKLVDLGTGAFQTVVPGVDPRRHVSFGATAR